MKFATKHRSGSRKRKPPNIRKTSRPSRNVPAPEPASDTVDVLPNTPQAVTALCSSGDYTPNVDAFSDACLPAAPRGCAATPADSTAAVTEVNSESVVPAPTSTGTENEPCSRNSRTIQVHQEPQFISSEELNVTAATVRESVCSVPATERKFRLTADGGSSAAADSNEEEGSRAFEVNLRSVQAIKSTGKGATALTDFWSVMNVSYRGLHQKTFQGHLKAKFGPAANKSATNVCADAAEAVKGVYADMDPTYTKNITVIYDGTWMTRGHSSHIGVGAVIEFYSGLELDFVVPSNYCHGCTLGPKPGDSNYNEWRQTHQCQKNTDVKSGKMEVEAALVLFRRSLEKYDLCYTTIVCNGDCRTYWTLCEDRTYGFIQFTKEDCVNHAEKRMGTNLRSVVAKSDRDQPLGGRGCLTQDLIKRLTSYYGQALRGSDNVQDMQRAVMATFHHITSTDEEPHHELCPAGPTSWCRHRAAEAKDEPQPAHKYKLKPHVAAAMLPVFKRLSEPQLLERCKGKKTQNASESLHSVIWSIMPKDKHASLIAVETAVSEAVCRFNSGTLRALQDMDKAAEKDALRKKRAQKAHEDKENKS
ncbi:hypothetical protein HPB48_017967 [Haemaphysalis longicornis]|uniref:Mutator-like transposase domain-containing protein n=1 Tax=Haemaphysalis longicornis TaxID=44386 RepID=A0A9J6FP20_HAELO|nr:hypothetical protein HPB48_017967 [Haemaphysalis longicornis]